MPTARPPVGQSAAGVLKARSFAIKSVWFSRRSEETARCLWSISKWSLRWRLANHARRTMAAAGKWEHSCKINFRSLCHTRRDIRRRSMAL